MGQGLNPKISMHHLHCSYQEESVDRQQAAPPHPTPPVCVYCVRKAPKPPAVLWTTETEVHRQRHCCHRIHIATLRVRLHPCRPPPPAPPPRLHPRELRPQNPNPKRRPAAARQIGGSKCGGCRSGRDGRSEAEARARRG
jgi:hypothetical protein